MKPLGNLETLHDYSRSTDYLSLTDSDAELLVHLETLQNSYNFPTLHKDVGLFISFLVSLTKPQNIFEFGSGYGHSSFWYYLAQKDDPFINKVILTERREDLRLEFINAPWAKGWREICDYHQADAFDVMSDLEHKINFLLIDGQKSSYQKFIEHSLPKLSKGCLIFVDNSFWRGGFLKRGELKKSDKAIAEFHKYVEQSTFTKCFIPFSDGVTLLKY